MKKDSKKEIYPEEMKPVISGLASYVKDAWERNKRAKLAIDEKLSKSLRQRNSIYEPDRLAAIRAIGGSEAYISLTSKKCSDAKSWILDILQQGKPWEVRATPRPDLPPNITSEVDAKIRNLAIQEALHQEAVTGIPVDVRTIKSIEDAAKTRFKKFLDKTLDDDADETAKRMDELIEDQFREGHFYEELMDVVDDFVTFPVCIMEGPILRNKKVKKYVKGPKGFEVKVSTEIVKEWARVSPFDVYPDPDAFDCQTGNFIHRRCLHRRDFTEMFDVPGYNQEAIREILQQFGTKGFHEWLTTDQARAAGENRQFAIGNESESIDVLSLWGSIQGKLLLEYGMDDKKITDPEMEYECNIWMVAGIVFRAVINPDPLGRRPYGNSSMYSIPGAFWGRSIPDLICDDQDMCNAAARAMINNIGLSSGPLYEIDIDRCSGSDTGLYPLKKFESTSKQMQEGPAVRFHNVPSNVEANIRVYDKFSLMADEHSGIPAYQQGYTANIGGAGTTASGLTMLMNASSRSIKGAIKNLDVGVIQKIVDLILDWNMLYHDDESVKGDLNAYALGSTALIMKEQLAVRRMEFAKATNNPTDFSIMGSDGRRALLKSVVLAQDMPVDEIFPDMSQDLNQGMNQEMNQGVPAPTPQAPMEKPSPIDSAGNKVSGQDTRLYGR